MPLQENMYLSLPMMNEHFFTRMKIETEEDQVKENARLYSPPFTFFNLVCVRDQRRGSVILLHATFL